MEKEIKIRKGLKKDIPNVLKLIKELAEYENAKEEVIITEKQLEIDGFGDSPCYQFLIAEYNNIIVGLSFYWIRYSTWKGKFLFLEDFVVTNKYRRKGIGSKLFKKTIDICKELEVNGMIWQVLDWNEPAINFYKKYNANISNKWLNGKLTKDQIDKIHAEISI